MSNPGAGPGNPLLRSSIDADSSDDILGKVYDHRIVKRLSTYLSGVKWHLVIGAIGVILRTVANLVTPLLVGVATNSILEANIDGLTITAIVYLVVLVLVWGAQYTETLHLSYAAQGILFKMRTNMFSHLHKLSLSFFDRNKVGKIMSRIQNDVEQLQILVSQNVIMIAVNVVTLVGIIVIMIVVNWGLALISLSTLPLLVILMVIWQKHARRAFILACKAIAMVNDNLQESVSGVRVTQNLSREAQNVKEFDEVNKANLVANKKAALLQALIMPLTQMLTDSSYMLVLVFGGFQVLDGTMQVGFLLTFLLYIQRIAMPIQQLATLYTEIQRAMASGSRIFELLEVKPEIEDSPGAVEMPSVNGEIEFNNVSFAYMEDSEILHEINIAVKPGETIAIIGRTGAGKSSIASLIERFYEADKGTISIGGYNINSVTKQSLRRQIGFVPQDPYLFSGSIQDNILDGKPDATHDDVVNAARAVGAHDVISRMEHGYNTQVGERGNNLSPGQRQLVCLARAIISDPAILILDEATSSVDTNTEQIIQQSLDNLSKGRTCIVIAHRLSTIVNADRIIVLEYGKIIETGSHTELMRKQGAYYEMFQIYKS